MKLNKFFDKPTVIRHQPVFELTNSLKEEQLEHEIKELEIQIQTFEGIEVENESLRLALNNDESTLREIRQQADSTNEKLILQEKTLLELENIKIEYDGDVTVLKPPPKTPLTVLHTPAMAEPPSGKSPKSVALPSEPIVI